MKTTIKRVVKTVLTVPGRRWRIGSPCARILTYHNVGNRAHEMTVNPSAFCEQLTWLKASRRVVPLSEAATGTDGVAITFDDGYRDNLLNAAPVLRELELPATVFMVAGKAGGFLRAETNTEAARLMTWDELRAIERFGIRVGAHTLTHARLSALDELQQQREIIGSKTLLEDQLGHPITDFAYPFGAALDYTSVTVRLVRESGFVLAVSNRYGPTQPGADPWTLRRIWIDRSDTLNSFRAKVLGDLDLLRCLDSAVGIRSRRMLNRILKAD